MCVVFGGGVYCMSCISRHTWNSFAGVRFNWTKNLRVMAIQLLFKITFCNEFYSFCSMFQCLQCVCCSVPHPHRQKTRSLPRSNFFSAPFLQGLRINDHDPLKVFAGWTVILLVSFSMTTLAHLNKEDKSLNSFTSSVFWSQLQLLIF